VGALRFERAYLVFGIQGDDAGFMRAHNCLASLDDVGIRLALQLVGNEKQEEASLEQVDAEELRRWLALLKGGKPGITYEWHE
jgi:hypothetical protein